MINQSDGAVVSSSHEPAPPRVRILHKLVGDVHVFTANGVDDFQVADRDLEAAFSSISRELRDVVAGDGGVCPPYVLNLTFREYSQALYGVHRNPEAPVALYAVIAKHAHMVDPNADYVPPARLRREALLRQRGLH